MTKKGTFVINGCERVIINQLIRSPGIYYRKEKIISGRKFYSATLISNRGSWLKFEFKREKKRQKLVIKMDNKAEFNIRDLLYSIGLSYEEIYFSLLDPNILRVVLLFDADKDQEEDTLSNPEKSSLPIPRVMLSRGK